MKNTYLLKNQNLTILFQNFFGQSVISAYICLEAETQSYKKELISANDHIEEQMQNQSKNLYKLDPGCLLVLEINKGDQHSYTMIEFASQSSPMEISKFEINKAILVNH